MAAASSGDDAKDTLLPCLTGKLLGRGGMEEKRRTRMAMAESTTKGGAVA